MSCADDFGAILIEVVFQHIAGEAEGITRNDSKRNPTGTRM